MKTTILSVISAKRFALALLAVTLAAAAPAPRQSTPIDSHSHPAQGCQATAPGSSAAMFEPAAVAATVDQVSSAPGATTRAGEAVTPPLHSRSIHSAFTFARPHDPGHLHAFSLLI